MKYLSVCSGIEAASVAWGPLGFQPVAFSEIEAFPCSVLAHHYLDVPNLGDMTKFEEWDIEPGSIDVLVGGTPCQSFSVAGLRGGLEDGRGNLALTYCRIVQKLQPKWFVWENVPGVLTSNGGRDFGSILGAMAELGYSFTWRILDAQYFGVPQRRRRVFVVGHLGNWRRVAGVLFESGCVSGNTQKGSKKKQNVAALTATGVGTCGADDNQGQAGHLIADARNGTVGQVSQTLQSHGCRTDGKSYTLEARSVPQSVSVAESVGVRRLTPRECERLQGFPDDWTLVLHRGKPAANGPRYKAIGNSMAVPVMRWIGRRIIESMNQ